jgi:hypothetical protein
MTKLHNREEIEAAGRTAVADWPPLSDEEIEVLVPLVMPAFEEQK